MKKPDNLAELPTSYVVVTSEAEADMVEDTGKFKIDKEERGRRLKKTRDWFETEKEYLEYLLVMDALDIELFPGDEETPKSIEFNWDLISYDKQDIKIQLHFDEPDQISDSATEDLISVTFWGTEFFKSDEGEPVRYGEQVYTTIVRQVDPERAGDLEKNTQTAILILGSILMLFILILACTGESLLPIWIFGISLTTIVHTLLFNITMPEDTYVVMKVMLKFLRLDFVTLESDEQFFPPTVFTVAGYQSIGFF